MLRHRKGKQIGPLFKANRRVAVAWSFMAAGNSFLRYGSIMEVSYLFAEVVQHGLRCIAFCKTRKLCELVLSYTRKIIQESAAHLVDSVCAYRAGYIAQVLIYSPDGRCLSKYQAYESGLGVKSVSWSPCGQFLVVGSYDQMLRVLSHLTWKVFAEFTHLSNVRAPCSAAIFKEVDEPLQLDMSGLSLRDDLVNHNSV